MLKITNMVRTVGKKSKYSFGNRFANQKFNGLGVSFGGLKFSTSGQVYNDFEFATLVELQQKACLLYKDKPAFGTLKGDVFEWSTYSQLGRDVQKFRNVLLHLNFKFNDKMAIISNNRVEWPVCAYATMSLGGQVVPM